MGNKGVYISWTCFPDVADISGPEVIKLFSSSAQLSMKFQLRINTEIAQVNENFRFRYTKPVIYPAYKC